MVAAELSYIEDADALLNSDTFVRTESLEVPTSVSLSAVAKPKLSQAPTELATTKRYGLVDVAAAYAVAQVKIENQLVVSEPSQYVEIARTVLAQYGELQPYERMFMGGINALVKAHTAVEGIWHTAMVEANEPAADLEQIAETGGAALARALLANTELGHANWFSYFAFKEPCTVSKGKFTITFYVNSCDADVLFSYLNPQRAGNKMGGMHMRARLTPHGAVPMLFIRSDGSDGDDEDRRVDSKMGTITHEAQHALSKVLLSGYDEVLSITSITPPEYNLYQKAVENSEHKQPKKGVFQEELAAYFASISGIEANTANNEKIYASIHNLCGSIEDFYLAKYATSGLTGSETFFKDNASMIASAIMTAREHFLHEEGFTQYDADRAAMKMLRRIPIKNWGTAVRILAAKQ